MDQNNQYLMSSNVYGRVPAGSTSRFHPEMKPEVQYNDIVISQPTTTPRPHPLTTVAYDYFEMPKRVSQPYQFATEQPANTQSDARKCPCCFNCVANFKLKNDPTTSVFCASCRQPYHICPIHKVNIAGMGPNTFTPEAKQCQCELTQGFLNDTAWNSCFNK
jgi:hypothetical protein